MPPFDAQPTPDGNVDDFDAAMDDIAAGTQSPVNTADDANAPMDDKADDDQPLEQSDGEQQVAAPAPASEQPSDDIWKDAPPALREAFDREKRDSGYKLASAMGRQSAADRKIAELMRAQQPSGQSDDDGSAGADNGAATPNRFETPEILKLREDYGDIASPLIDMLREQADQIAMLSAPVQALETGRAEAERMTQYEILGQAHPDWQTLSADERWGGWIAEQPRAIQEAYDRNVDVSDGKEAAMVLGLFKQDMGITAAPTPRMSVDPRRQRQLDAGRDGGRSGGQPTTNEVPDDFDAALDVELARSERRRQSNRVTSM